MRRKRPESVCCWAIQFFSLFTRQSQSHKESLFAALLCRFVRNKAIAFAILLSSIFFLPSQDILLMSLQESFQCFFNEMRSNIFCWGDCGVCECACFASMRNWSGFGVQLGDWSLDFFENLCAKSPIMISPLEAKLNLIRQQFRRGEASEWERRMRFWFPTMLNAPDAKKKRNIFHLRIDNEAVLERSNNGNTVETWARQRNL